MGKQPTQVDLLTENETSACSVLEYVLKHFFRFQCRAFSALTLLVGQQEGYLA